MYYTCNTYNICNFNIDIYIRIYILNFKTANELLLSSTTLNFKLY